MCDVGIGSNRSIANALVTPRYARPGSMVHQSDTLTRAPAVIDENAQAASPGGGIRQEQGDDDSRGHRAQLLHGYHAGMYAVTWISAVTMLLALVFAARGSARRRVAVAG
jgi:hypothetical protein